MAADIRGLNYDKYFSQGECSLAEIQDYHSHNVQQLDVDQTVELLLKLPYIQGALAQESIPTNATMYAAKNFARGQRAA